MHVCAIIETKIGDYLHRNRYLSWYIRLWHVNPEVVGSNPTLVNLSLFNPKSQKQITQFGTKDFTSHLKDETESGATINLF